MRYGFAPDEDCVKFLSWKEEDGTYFIIYYLPTLLIFYLIYHIKLSGINTKVYERTL